MDAGLLILRVVVGVALVGHGTQKLFGWFGGAGPRGTGAFFEMLGYRPGELFAVVAGASEAGGGVLLGVGLLTPLAGAAVVGVMLVAAVLVARSRPMGDERRVGVHGRPRHCRCNHRAYRCRVGLDRQRTRPRLATRDPCRRRGTRRDPRRSPRWYCGGRMGHELVSPLEPTERWTKQHDGCSRTGRTRSGAAGLVA